MRLEVRAEAAAPPAVVWELLTHWERQPEWMLDAMSVEVLTPQRRGVGVTLRCPTDLLGVTVDDVLRVTGWEHQRRLEVTHLGAIITGSGAFELSEIGPGGEPPVRTHPGTRIDWWEEVDPPLGAFGEWSASTLLRPVLRRIFARSLRNLAELAEAEVADDPR